MNFARLLFAFCTQKSMNHTHTHTLLSELARAHLGSLAVGLLADVLEKNCDKVSEIPAKVLQISALPGSLYRTHTHTHIHIHTHTHSHTHTHTHSHMHIHTHTHTLTLTHTLTHTLALAIPESSWRWRGIVPCSSTWPQERTTRAGRGRGMEGAGQKGAWQCGERAWQEGVWHGDREINSHTH